MREQVAKDVVPTVASTPYAEDFRAVVPLAELGPVQLSVLAYPAPVIRAAGHLASEVRPA